MVNSRQQINKIPFPFYHYFFIGICYKINFLIFQIYDFISLQIYRPFLNRFIHARILNIQFKLMAIRKIYSYFNK